MHSDGGDHGKCRALVLRRRWAILDAFSGPMGLPVWPIVASSFSFGHSVLPMRKIRRVPALAIVWILSIAAAAIGRAASPGTKPPPPDSQYILRMIPTKISG